MELKSLLKRLANRPLLIVTILLVAAVIIFSFKLNPAKVLGINSTKPGEYLVTAEAVATVNSRYRMIFTAETQGQAVNAVGLYLKYDQEVMKIINMDTTKSFCQFYPENKFDNVNGTVMISCGAPNPGFTGTSDIAIIDFYINNIGKTEIEILPNSMLLLNDGKGTNIFNQAVTHELTILNNI